MFQPYFVVFNPLMVQDNNEYKSLAYSCLLIVVFSNQSVHEPEKETLLFQANLKVFYSFLVTITLGL